MRATRTSWNIPCLVLLMLLITDTVCLLFPMLISPYWSHIFHSLLCGLISLLPIILLLWRIVHLLFVLFVICWRTIYPDRKLVCWDSSGGSQHNQESPLERGEGDNFQTIILQGISQVSGFRNIHDHIDSRLDL